MLTVSGGSTSLQYVFRDRAVVSVLLSKMPWTWVCLSDLLSWIVQININLFLRLVQHQLVSVQLQTLLVCRLVSTAGWWQILQQLSFRPPRVS